MQKQCNNVTMRGAQYLSLGLLKLKYLSTLSLNLDYNDLSYEGACMLSEQISKLEQLISLELRIDNNKRKGLF